MLYSFKNFEDVEVIEIAIPQNVKSILFNYCKNKFNQYLPNFDKDKADYLIVYLQYLIFIMSNYLNIEISDDSNSIDIFLKQISMNNDRNFLALVNLFLPYLDDKNNNYNQKNVKGLLDIIQGTNDNVSDNKMKYCNYIYDHSDIKEVTHNSNQNIKLLQFEINNKIPFTDKINDFEFYYIKVLFYFILDSFNRIRYKFYINWINTFPLTLETYKSSLLYKNSWEYDEKSDKIKKDNLLLNFSNYVTSPNYRNIDATKIIDITKDSEENIINKINESGNESLSYKGINFEDVYNTLVNDYYLSVKRNKWLIFEFNIGNKIELLINVLNNIFDLTPIINNLSWYLLNENQKSNFNDKWKLFLEAISEKSSVGKYNYLIIESILISLVSYFELHYKKINQLKTFNLYQNLKENINDDDDQDDIEIDNGNVKFKNKKVTLKIEDFYNSIKNVPFEDIYDFLNEEINELKLSPYNFMIFQENKLQKLEFNKINLSDNGASYELTPKNYYNYAKRLLFKSYDINSIYYDEDNLLFQNLWSSNSIEDKFIIILRINQFSLNQNWFNISNVLKKINYESINIKKYTEIIYKKIKSKLVDLTFENLIRKGCICKFEYNPEVSDSAILTNDYFTKNKRLAENLKKYVLTPEKIKEYKQGYYFANNMKYENMEDLHITYQNKEKSINYIDYLSDMEISGDKWFTFYAVDWVAQLDFYIKFMNQRVMYITGATGQGKSTQVPKLYLYGLKSLLYKNNGKIFCTVPRIDPILENAIGISRSMGLPIQNYDEEFKNNIRTLNGIVQYQYSSDNHINVNSQYFLRLMTDGTLLQILYSNQMLKEQKISNKQNKLNPTIKMSNKNVCDIVMIDEAHEHNSNMDIILTIMRHTLFYNNDIKLSIISATMEDDEPIFRKFYRFVDDNLIYPINLYDLNFGLDHNLIDRRFHISPPGETTQHKVDEYYEENSEDTYDSNEKLAIEKVNKIFESTPEGEILLFSTTEKKINNLVDLLNKQIPNNCIALPYYSKLKTEYKNLSKNAKSEIKQITFDRSDVLDLFSNKISYDNAKKVSAGTYNRVCIIATNAAEASLTITSLKFVVDIGYTLSLKYNYDTLLEEPIEEKITEASRVQRRGRVGRVASGLIYHMYPKNARLNIVPEYDISKSNFSSNFRDMLTNDDSENNIIINGKLLYKLVTLQKLDDSDSGKLKKNINRKLIYYQYKISKEFYEGNQSKFINLGNNFIKENYFNYLFPSYYSGFSSANLLDKSGHFYIINPLEGIIKRNINSSNFIDLNSNNTYLNDEDLNKIYFTAKINLEIINFNNMLFKTNTILELNNINSKIINKEYDDDYVKIIALSYILDNSENLDLLIKILFIYRLLKTHINFDVKNLLSNNKDLNPNFFKDKEIIDKNLKQFFYENKIYDSDLEFFYNLFDNIIKIINFNEIGTKLDNENKEISKKLYEYINVNNLKYESITAFSKYNNFDFEKTNFINKLILKGDISLNGIAKDDNTNFFNNNIRLILENNETLKQFCKINNFDFKIISSALSDSLIEYYSLKSKFDEFKDSIENLRTILNLPVISNLNDNIKMIFLFCFVKNLYYINNGNIFSLINSHELTPKYNFLSDLSTFGFYLNFNNDKKDNSSISLLSNLTKSDILNSIPTIIYFIKNEGKKYLNYKDIELNIDKIYKKINNFSYSNNEKTVNIDGIKYTDINISNILMKRLIGKPKLLDNQEGGMLIPRPYRYLVPYPFINPFILRSPLIKMRIDTVKKIDKLKEIVKDKNLLEDDYDFAYVAHSADRSDIISFYLCNKDSKYSNILEIDVLLNDYNYLPKLVNRLMMRGIQCKINMMDK